MYLLKQNSWHNKFWYIDILVWKTYSTLWQVFCIFKSIYSFLKYILYGFCIFCCDQTYAMLLTKEIADYLIFKSNTTAVLQMSLNTSSCKSNAIGTSISRYYTIKDVFFLLNPFYSYMAKIILSLNPRITIKQLLNNALTLRNLRYNMFQFKYVIIITII